ncbi:MAG TPA: RDD family protein [Pyrinomonadaceae bacterium]|jgi:Mce-associated membrane protein
MTARIEEVRLAQADEGAKVQAYLERFRAPFSLRCGALLIDYILIVMVIAFSTLWARLLGGGARMAGGTTETVGLVFALLIAILDLFVLPGLRGQTLGKWATGLRIVSREGEPVGFGRIALRQLLGYTLSFLTLGAGFLLAAFSAHGRALHDFVAGTVVVRHDAHRARRVR